MALGPFDRGRAEAAVRELLLALGFDPDREPELLDTPARVATAYGQELLRGYSVDLAGTIARGSEPIEGPWPDAIVVDGIQVVTVCPHHLMTGEGQALVAYLPGERLLGLGTVAKVVDAVSRRLVLQERIAGDVVDALMNHAGARGAFCRVHLRHACLRARGPEQHSAEAISFAGRGAFEDPANLELLLGRRLTGDTTP
ncbi:MAG TPA: GTP cyclohydrolase I [Polyangiaceae bacterium]|nr:GTP cyclohydrolase I [Polyangiaceae bacterium]